MGHRDYIKSAGEEKGQRSFGNLGSKKKCGAGDKNEDKGENKLV